MIKLVFRFMHGPKPIFFPQAYYTLKNETTKFNKLRHNNIFLIDAPKHHLSILGFVEFAVHVLYDTGGPAASVVIVYASIGIITLQYITCQKLAHMLEFVRYA